jgi:hypothetical protein
MSPHELGSVPLSLLSYTYLHGEGGKCNDSAQAPNMLVVCCAVLLHQQRNGHHTTARTGGFSCTAWRVAASRLNTRRLPQLSASRPVTVHEWTTAGSREGLCHENADFRPASPVGFRPCVVNGDAPEAAAHSTTLTRCWPACQYSPECSRPTAGHTSAWRAPPYEVVADACLTPLRAAAPPHLGKHASRASTQPGAQ